MGFADNAQQDFNDIAQSDKGTAFTLRHFSFTLLGSADYDIGSAVSQSGTDIAGQGFIQPINAVTAGTEFKYLEQGAINLNDKVLFFSGSIDTAGDLMQFAINGSIYKTVPDGILEWSHSGLTVYKKAHLQILNAGSFSQQ